jgi:endoribonuclease Dicer
MVSNQALGAICIEVGLHDHLMFESFDLANKIRVYAESLKQKRDAEYEQARKEDRPPGQYWIDTTPPKASFPRLCLNKQRLILVPGTL